MGAFVEFENVSKIYKTGDVEVHALTDASFEIQKDNFPVYIYPQLDFFQREYMLAFHPKEETQSAFLSGDDHLASKHAY